MPLVARITAVVAALVIGVATLAIAAFIWSGVYNVGADAPHWRPTYAVLEMLRHRSIDARTRKVQVPSDLATPARIRQGAGNYAAMCAGCHLAPGMPETEMSKGLYPAPPQLARTGVGAAHAFWVIKHGIKASGMPAWGKSMEDEYIWNMAAFLQELPKLDARQYRALVDSSEGHSHGGGETRSHEHAPGMDHGAMETSEAAPHPHEPGTPAHEDAGQPRADQATPKAHVPGSPPHDHGAKAAAQQAHDEHDHEH